MPSDIELTPSQIVHELDKYIIGQERAKQRVALGLRNRIRKIRLPAGMRDEASPKNIIMIGLTGVGKTEIARRLDKLTHVPFVKVEATKFTEAGYVGRDVESMVHDLMANAISMVKSEHRHGLHKETKNLIGNEKVNEIAKERVEQHGIIFLDEIDKIISQGGGAYQNISREGVQKDILPIVKGSIVHTRQGSIDTTHILFIAAGAFQAVKPSDLIPELQGRFPLRVELQDLSEEDFIAILSTIEPHR